MEEQSGFRLQINHVRNSVRLKKPKHFIYGRFLGRKPHKVPHFMGKLTFVDFESDFPPLEYMTKILKHADTANSARDVIPNDGRLKQTM